MAGRCWSREGEDQGMQRQKLRQLRKHEQGTVTLFSLSFLLTEGIV